MVPEKLSRDDSHAHGRRLYGAQRLRERHTYWLFTILLLYVIVRAVIAAARTPLWYDEILTSLISSQRSWKAILGALWRPLDGQPPFFYAIESLTLPLTQTKEIALRLPAIFAFPCCMIAVFAFVKRRSNERIALLISSLLLSTILFQRYAFEARPYALIVACFASALVCYQRLPSAFYAVMLAVCLAFAQALHYFAIFAMVPFGLAEGVVLLRSRRFRWQVWAALLFGVLPLWFAWPIISHFKAYYGPHYWSHYHISSLPGTYGALFLTDSAWGVGLTAVAIAGVAGAYFCPRKPPVERFNSGGYNLVEGVVLLGFLGLPLIALAIVSVTHGGMRDAYVLATVLGVCPALASALSMGRSKAIVLFALFVFACVSVREFKFWRSVHSRHLTSSARTFADFVQRAGHPDLPVVVSNGMIYVPQVYYATGDFGKRLFYIPDEQKAVQYFGTDTFDKTAVILKDYMPIQTEDFTRFTALYPAFLLYAEEPGAGGSWLLDYLSRTATVQCLAVDPDQRMYLVNMKTGPSSLLGSELR